VRASDEARGPEAPPERALDGDDATAWCPGGEGTGAWLEVGFLHPVTVESLSFVAGPPCAGDAGGPWRRIRSVHVADGRQVVEVDLEGDGGREEVRLETPLAGSRVVVTIDRVESGAGRPCLWGLELGLRDGARVGTRETAARADLPAGRRRLLGLWVQGPEGAPTHQLVFGMNGEFRLTYLPLEELDRGRAQRVAGRYDFDGERLRMGRAAEPLKTVRLATRTGGAIELAPGAEGAAHELLAGTFRRVTVAF
jgi:hypothetical protein